MTIIDTTDRGPITTTIGLDELCVNTIRTLAMDAVEEANSGHPGTPMALAPVVYCLWQRGRSLGMETFGASAPLQELQKKFGFTLDHVVAAAKQQIADTR